MGLSNLQLETYFVEHITCKNNKDFKKEEKPDLKGFNVSFKTGINAEDPLIRKISLMIQQEPAQGIPYEFQLNIVGIIKINESFAARKDETELEYFVNTNGPAVLYSAAREFLAIITGRSKHGQILLPVVTFADFFPEQKDKQKKSRSSKPQTKRKK